MYQGDGKQGTDRLNHQNRPLDPVHLRLASQDPLAPGIERALQGGDDLPLRHHLTGSLWVQRHRGLQCLRQRLRDHRERSLLSGHRRPFHRLGLVDLLPYQRAQPLARRSRKARRHEDDRAERARLAVHRGVGPLHVAPDLCREKGDHKTEDDPQGRQQPGRHSLEVAHPVAAGQAEHDGVEQCRCSVGGRENQNCHKPHRETVDPIAHGLTQGIAARRA